MNSLIDGDVLRPLSDLGIELLNKIEKATGWIFSTETAKKKGYSNIIEEISKRDDINPIEKAMIISQFRKIVREYKNKTKITSKTVELLETGKNINNIDNDWLCNFFDYCKNVSYEDMQYIWAKILADNCENKHSHSLNFLRILSDITKNEIDIIMKVVKEYNYASKSFEAIGILNLSSEYLNSISLEYKDIVKLEDLGIMKREQIGLKDKIHYELKDKTITFIKKENKKSRFHFDTYANYYRLTYIGMELLDLIDIELNENFFDRLYNALKEEYDMQIEEKK